MKTSEAPFPMLLPFCSSISQGHQPKSHDEGAAGSGGAQEEEGRTYRLEHRSGHFHEMASPKSNNNGVFTDRIGGARDHKSV